MDGSVGGSGDGSGDGAGRDELLTAYRRLVLQELPERAHHEGWVVSADHCFGRIVLDNALGRRWYDVLGRRGAGPAFERLELPALRRAVQLAEEIAAHGDPLLRELDARSLAWRGKPQKPSTHA